MSENLSENNGSMHPLIPKTRLIPGQVVNQQPRGGQTRKIASKRHKVEVKVQVSLGKSSFTLSDYANQEYRQVRILLGGLGAKVAVEEKESSSVIAGYIISTTPPAGSIVSNGETVTLHVSKGAHTSYGKMIDVKGMDAGAAKRKLFSANFLVGTVTYEHSSTVPEGKVISQGIAPGTSTALKYTEVPLVVSIGPAPTQP